MIYLPLHRHPAIGSSFVISASFYFICICDLLSYKFIFISVFNIHHVPTRHHCSGRWQLPCPETLLEESSKFGSACAVRNLLEAEAWVEDGQRCGGHENHDAFEDDEKSLIAYERARPAAAELGDAKDTADEYADGSKAERAQK